MRRRLKFVWYYPTADLSCNIQYVCCDMNRVIGKCAASESWLMLPFEGWNCD